VNFTLLDAVDDPQLFAPWFKDRSTWAAWFVFLRALFGLPLAPHQLALFTECTGRTEAPTMPAWARSQRAFARRKLCQRRPQRL
jgi:hypothetical protein